MLNSFLSTKIYIPEIQDNHIMRSDLVQKLIYGIKSGRKLSLVSAPTGYGKTTLVLELLKSIDYRKAWVSLDEGDNDSSRFLSYIIEALKNAGVSVGDDTQSLVYDINASSGQTAISMIINDIMSFSYKTVLVLDDFHMVNSSYVCDSVRFLIEHQPSNLHIIIITREDPDISIPRLRMQGKLTEIRVEDLRFTKEETRGFFSKLVKLELSEDNMDKVYSRTEGWAAGLQLAGLSIKGNTKKDVSSFIEEFDGTNSYIIDYLVEEVLGKLSDETRSFLCSTSVLDRMNGELCNAVSGREDSKALLQKLEKDNLFLISLDNKREWYRYHHLFADSLRMELTREDEKRLNKIAALWHRNNGFKMESVEYAFRSGDMGLALTSVEENTEELFKKGRIMTLVKWLERLPDDLVINSEALCVRKALAFYITGSINETVAYLDTLGEDFLEKASKHNKGLIFCLKGIIGQHRKEDPYTIEAYAQQALDLLEAWDPIARVFSMNILGRARERQGKRQEAYETFRHAYEEGLKIGFSLITTLALFNLGQSMNALGKRNEAIKLFKKYEENMITEFGKTLPYIGVIYIGLASLYFDEKDLEKADIYITDGVQLCRSISYNWVPYSEELEAKIKSARADKKITYPKDDLLIEKLSSREQEILELIAEGLSNAEISRRLFISTNTAQWHISHIYSKLGVKSRTQAILRGKELGILCDT